MHRQFRAAWPRTFAGIIALSLAVSVGVGCGGGESEDVPSAHTEIQVYDVRGVLTQLPGTSGRELMIRHEAIPDFVSAGGDTVGMDPMVMGFPLADGVSLEGLEVGQKVRFTFEVRWSGSPPLRLSRIEALPEDTELVFRKLEEM